MKGTYIGQIIPRIDAESKVTGTATYPGDVALDDMLHMKLRFAGRPHARVLRIDTDVAAALPGVVAILTAADVPVNEYGLQYPDQPVLVGPGGDKQGTDVARFIGDQIAAVVAESAAVAAQAADLIHVDYADLPIITDPREALKPETPPLHPPYPGLNIHPELVFEGNLVSRHRIRHGDVQAALLDADVIVEAEYDIPGQEHAYLQPEAGVAYLDEAGRVTIIASGQWAHEDRQQVAHALDMPEEQVRIIYPAIGGAFGGREDMSVQIVLALAVQRLAEQGIVRPVRIEWSREESLFGHHKRHRAFAHARWAATRDGKLLVAETHVIADAGAYTYTTNKVMGNLVLTVNGPYKIPHVKTEVLAAYTNNIPGGAFRGFGAPQGNFIAEAQMNKLAAALGMDPVELRLRNLVRDGDPMPWGKPLPDDARGLEDSLLAAASALGWKKDATGWHAPVIKAKRDDAPYIQRGAGIALAFKNIGYSFGYPENAWAALELHGATEIEAVKIFAASSEVGQGTRTVICQMAAEALAVPLDKVTLEAADTSITGSSGSCSASRMTFMIGNAIRGAAELARDKWAAQERPACAEYTYLAPKTTLIDKETGYGHPNFAYGYVAIAAEVAVDTRTGECRYPRIACANDVGQAINPRLLEGQIEGGVIQAFGWATTENLVQHAGILQSKGFSTYLIPTIEDIPDYVIPIIIENPIPHGPWGARGMGEMPFIAVASAIQHALHDATGIWYNRFPFTVECVLRGLRGIM